MIVIKDIEIYHIKYPVKKLKYPIANHVLNGSIYIKILTNCSIVGYGEPSSYILDYFKLFKLFKIKLLPFLINQKINDINLINLKKKVDNKLIEPLVAGLDQAIWDIKSKLKNRKLNEFISNKQRIEKKIFLYASGGMIFDKQSNDKIINEALKFKSLGFKGYKFRPSIPKEKISHFKRMKFPPPIEIKNFIKNCELLRLKVGMKYKLMVDLGCRLISIKQFDYLSEALNELHFSFIEEPFKRDINIYKKISKKSKIKIAFGESLTSEREFKNWINYVDIIQPDTNMITISELLNLKKIFKSSEKEIIFHNWSNPISMLSNFHMAKVFNSTLIEYNITSNPIINKFQKYKFKIINGEIKLGSRKGLGVDINEEFLNKYSKKII